MMKRALFLFFFFFLLQSSIFNFQFSIFNPSPSAGERPASPPGELQKRIRGASSSAQLREALNQVTREVDSLLARGGRGWEGQQIALDLVDLVASRAHELDDRGEKVADLFPKAAALFTRVSEANAQQMEEMASRTAESEEDPEKLYESEGWRRAEFLSSMVRYRLSKARYYWALALKESSPERGRLLQEALTGFSPQAMEYQSQELISYCHLGRALCYRELGKPEEALKELGIVDKTEGNLRSPLAIRASQERVNLYLSLHRYREGLQEIDRLLADLARSGGDANGLNRLRWFKVETLFSLILQRREKLEPRQVEEYHQQALSLVRQLAGAGGSWQEQASQLVLRNLEGLAEVREQVPGLKLSPFEGWLLAERAFLKKKYQEALPLYRQVIDSPAPEVRVSRELATFRVGICHYQLGQLQEAALAFSNFLSWFPKSPEGTKAAFLRYKAYETLHGDHWNPPYLEAARYYLDHWPSHPSASEVRYRLGRYYRKRGERLRAEEELSQVREDSPYLLDARFLAFRSYAEELGGRGKAGGSSGIGAQELYRKAISARKLLSGVLADRLRGGPASEVERSRLKEMGAYAALLAARIHARGPAGGSRQVLEELEGFEEAYPKQAELFLPVGLLRIEAWQKLGDPQGARKEVERFIQRHRGHPRAPELLSLLADQFQQEARRASSQGKTRAFEENSLVAAQLYESLLPWMDRKGAQGKAAYELRSQLAGLYLKLGEYGKARSFYTEMLEREPRSANALYGIGLTYEGQKEYQKALESWRTLEEALQEGHPYWYEVKYRLAFAHHRLGNSPQACKILQTTLALHPNLNDPGLKSRYLQLQKQVCPKALSEKLSGQGGARP